MGISSYSDQAFGELGFWVCWFFFHWLCSLEGCTCVLLSIQKVIAMSNF